MPKFALLKKVSFNFTEQTSLTNEFLLSHLTDKVFFESFDNTLNLFKRIHSLLGNGMVEILNCDYNETLLLQAFYLEESTDDVHENIILIKRKIRENDSYTFLDFDSEKSEDDKYSYLDVEMSDVLNLLKNKYSHSGVCVHSDGSLSNIEYVNIYNKDTHSGIMKILQPDGSYVENKYVDVNMIVHKHEKENPTEAEFATLLQQKIDDETANYIYCQKDFSIGLLNCHYQIIGINKNNIMSEIIGENIYGDVFVGLENKLNDDERILNLDATIFEKIVKLCKSSDFKPKNSLFCNLYYELA